MRVLSHRWTKQVSSFFPSSTTLHQYKPLEKWFIGFYHELRMLELWLQKKVARAKPLYHQTAMSTYFNS